MAYWLVKSEPSVWSWDDQVAAGPKGTPWEGVRNHLAKTHMAAMKKGDRAFFYHSNEGKEIVGIVEVAREAYPDPRAPGEPWVLVDLKAVSALPHRVSLRDVKAAPKLAKMALVTCPRLSVQPVRASEWSFILKLAERPAAP